jgi:hypothetical protein
MHVAAIRMASYEVNNGRRSGYWHADESWTANYGTVTDFAAEKGTNPKEEPWKTRYKM